jgi:anaphase-promoting complex subunit 5
MFDHKKEAVASLQECIMLAQENGDRGCLKLAQSWLCLLDKSNLQLEKKNIGNKTEVSLIHSLSLGIQTMVKEAGLAGYPPSKLFEVLLKSDILNCQHSIMDLTANCIAERAALWTMYGKNEISSMCSQLQLNTSLKTLGEFGHRLFQCLTFKNGISFLYFRKVLQRRRHLSVFVFVGAVAQPTR